MKSTEQKPQILSVAEAAARLGLSRVHVWRLIQAGVLPAVKIGHSYVIERRHLRGAKQRNRKVGWIKGRKRGKRLKSKARKQKED